MSAILAIGNPGSGKSTILNALAGKLLFQSGISYGSGLTSNLDIQEKNGRSFIDMPGLADDTYRKAAGEALTKVFRKGGKMKILFFVTQQAGRVVSQDVATMKLILEAVPEIGQNYGIVVNKVNEEVLSKLLETENMQSFVTSLYCGIKDEFKHNNIILLPSNEKLDSANNVLLDAADIHPYLHQFARFSVPDANITPDLVKDISVDEFDRLTKQIEELESELKANQEYQKAEKEKLVTQLEIAERGKMKQQEEDQRKHEEELKEIQKNIHEAEEKMKLANKDTEIKLLEQRIDGMKSMQEQTEQYLNEQQAFIAEQKAREQKENAGNALTQMLSPVLKMVTSVLAVKFLGPVGATAAAGHLASSLQKK